LELYPNLLRYARILRIGAILQPISIGIITLKEQTFQPIFSQKLRVFSNYYQLETMKTEYIINLDLPPEERWKFLTNYREEVNDLLQCYLNDFKGAEFIFESIGAYKHELISKEYLSEIEFIASISKF